MKRSLLALIALVSSAAADPVPTATLYREYIGATMADVVFSLVPNLSLTTPQVGVFDLVISYQDNVQRKFLGINLMEPNHPGYYSSVSFPGLDPSVGCELAQGAFTDANEAVPRGTFNIGAAGNTTWVANFDGTLVSMPFPSSFLATPSRIAEAYVNLNNDPQGFVTFITARIRVDFGSVGVISSVVRLAPGMDSRRAAQWQIAYIPEPASLTLVGAAFAALGLRRRRIHVSTGSTS